MSPKNIKRKLRRRRHTNYFRKSQKFPSQDIQCRDDVKGEGTLAERNDELEIQTEAAVQNRAKNTGNTHKSLPEPIGNSTKPRQVEEVTKEDLCRNVNEENSTFEVGEVLTNITETLQNANKLPLETYEQLERVEEVFERNLYENCEENDVQVELTPSNLDISNDKIEIVEITTEYNKDNNKSVNTAPESVKEGFFYNFPTNEGAISCSNEEELFTEDSIAESLRQNDASSEEANKFVPNIKIENDSPINLSKNSASSDDSTYLSAEEMKAITYILNQAQAKTVEVRQDLKKEDCPDQASVKEELPCFPLIAGSDEENLVDSMELGPIDIIIKTAIQVKDVGNNSFVRLLGKFLTIVEGSNDQKLLKFEILELFVKYLEMRDMEELKNLLEKFKEPHLNQYVP